VTSAESKASKPHGNPLLLCYQHKTNKTKQLENLKIHNNLGDKFAYLEMKNSGFARFPRSFNLPSQRRQMTCFEVVRTTQVQLRSAHTS